jgi:hypothetical protein
MQVSRDENSLNNLKIYIFFKNTAKYTSQEKSHSQSTARPPTQTLHKTKRGKESKGL